MGGLYVLTAMRHKRKTAPSTPPHIPQLPLLLLLLLLLLPLQGREKAGRREQGVEEIKHQVFQVLVNCRHKILNRAEELC